MNCSAASFPTSGLTDPFCGSCGKEKYASLNGSECINTTDSCQHRSTKWTDNDCSLCDPNHIYASSD